jgi:hypothetical protein
MSIDRRLFVQTAAAAVGGAAGLSSDAVAQERIQLAQAGPFVLNPPPATGGGPWKSYNREGVGDQAEKLYAFLKVLFARDVAGGTTYRDEIWNMTDDQVRNEVFNKLGYDMRGYTNTRIIIVDIQNGRVKFSDNLGCSSVGGCSIVNHGDDPTNTFWYTLVLPPLPLEYQKSAKLPEDGYLHEMTWESAWHHAIVYGYGM